MLLADTNESELSKNLELEAEKLQLCELELVRSRSAESELVKVKLSLDAQLSESLLRVNKLESEMNLLRSRETSLLGELRDREDEIVRVGVVLSQEASRHRADVQATRSELEEMSSKVTRTTSESEMALAKLKKNHSLELSSEKSRGSALLKALSLKFDSLHEDHAQLSEEIASKDKIIQSLDDRATSLSSTFELSMAQLQQLSSSRVASLSSQISVLESQLAMEVENRKAAEELANSQKEDMKEKLQDLSRLKHELNSAEDTISEYDCDVKLLTDDACRMKEVIQRLCDEHSHTKTEHAVAVEANKIALRNNLEEYQSELVRSEDEISLLRQERDALEGEHSHSNIQHSGSSCIVIKLNIRNSSFD